MRALGLDPGGRMTGYGVVELGEAGLRYIDAGVISLQHDPSDFPLRLRHLYQRVQVLLQDHRIQEVALENCHYARNAQATIRLGQVSGVLLLAAAATGLPTREYAPGVIRRAVVGYGAATKAQVKKMVCRLLGIREAGLSTHAADALAVAICHLHTTQPRRRPGGRP